MGRNPQTGEKIKIKGRSVVTFKPGKNLHHVLQRIEGHYIRGYGDRSSKSEVYLLEGAVEEANSLLKNDDKAQERLDSVARIIKGFETPYGMELLATVHWVANKNSNIAQNPDLVVNEVQKWSPRKNL